MKHEPKDYIYQIMKGKSVLPIDEKDKNGYIPRYVNKALSNYKDCIMLANLMNLNGHIDKKLQYDFLMSTVRSKKRPFVKFERNVEDISIDSVKKVFGYSDARAREAIKLLTEEQKETLRNMTDVGGNQKKP